MFELEGDNVSLHGMYTYICKMIFVIYVPTRPLCMQELTQMSVNHWQYVSNYPCHRYVTLNCNWLVENRRPSNSAFQMRFKTIRPFRFWHPKTNLQVIQKKTDMSSDQNPSDIPLYWLVDRDPYSSLWNNSYITGQFVIPYIVQPTGVKWSLLTWHRLPYPPRSTNCLGQGFFLL